MPLPDLINQKTPLEVAIEKATGKPVQKKKGRGKYGAIKTEVDGIIFHSKRESEYYRQYKILEKAGKLDNLKLQPVFPIIINDQKICKVILDFSFRELPGGKVRFIDCKGLDTAISRLKRKLVEALYNIKVEIVR